MNDSLPRCALCGEALTETSGECARCASAFESRRIPQPAGAPRPFDLRERLPERRPSFDPVSVSSVSAPPSRLYLVASFLVGTLSPLIIGFLIGWALRSYYPAEVADPQAPQAGGVGIAEEIALGARRELAESPVPVTTGAPGLVMTEFELSGQGADIRLTGSVANRGERRYELVTVTFQLLDASGAVIGELTDIRRSLDPGGVWRFTLPIADPKTSSVELTGLSGL